ncbi:MAG: FYDLN acid domain-containing protein [Kiloniellaceae bacterium]
MDSVDRGLKHTCSACATKYYDLRKTIDACPKCGSKRPAAKIAKATRKGQRVSGMPMRRYP